MEFDAEGESVVKGKQPDEWAIDGAKLTGQAP